MTVEKTEEPGWELERMRLRCLDRVETGAESIEDAIYEEAGKSFTFAEQAALVLDHFGNDALAEIVHQAFVDACAGAWKEEAEVCS